MTGHAIPAISIDDLAKVLIPMPPAQVQKKIANEISELLVMQKETLRTGERIVKEPSPQYI
jgi:hypothetical protein